MSSEEGLVRTQPRSHQSSNMHLRFMDSLAVAGEKGPRKRNEKRDRRERTGRGG